MAMELRKLCQKLRKISWYYCNIILGVCALYLSLRTSNAIHALNGRNESIGELYRRANQIQVPPNSRVVSLDYSRNITTEYLPFTTEPFPNWCPPKRCKTEPSLCFQQFLFVVSTGGRTGSTTLMNAMNAIPNVWISGETKGMISLLRQAYTKSVPFGRRQDQWVDGKTAVNAHYRTLIDRERVLLAVQDFVKRTNLPPSNRRGIPAVLGYKGIVWEPEDLKFAELAMPCSKFIINYRRDTEKQSKSNFLRLMKDGVFNIRNRTSAILAAQGNLNAPTYALPLEDFSLQNFTLMARWLGANCTFRKIGHHNLGSTRFGEGLGEPAVCI